MRLSAERYLLLSPFIIGPSILSMPCPSPPRRAPRAARRGVVLVVPMGVGTKRDEKTNLIVMISATFRSYRSYQYGIDNTHQKRSS